MKSHYILILCAAFSVSGCAQTMANAVGGQSAKSSDSIALEAMLSGQSATQGKELDKLIAEADKHPLGSDKNPVRVSGPAGQRAFLNSLRCEDGKVPAYFRVGNFGMGVFGNIVDGYEVTCANSAPAKSMVVMDMYHSGRTESRTITGFTKAP
jgi:hypothetical protein